jgi:hypothetical protein
MAKYAVELQDTLGSATTLGAIRCNATTVRRAKLYDLIFGSEATPADAAILFTATRVDATGQGTATSVTPAPLDPADAAALTAALENYTAEPTNYATVPLLSVALNQRASFRWVAAPGGELVIPATANHSIGFRTPTINTGTPLATMTVHFEEQ